LYCQEHEFEDGFIIGKNGSGFDRLAQASIDRFNGIGGIDEAAQVGL
jgi:hypothetical protein